MGVIEPPAFGGAVLAEVVVFPPAGGGVGEGDDRLVAAFAVAIRGYFQRGFWHGTGLHASAQYGCTALTAFRAAPTTAGG